MPNWNWDDLRFVAVLAETGTIAEAARKLNVNRTTVQRRIAAFEDQLAYRLFSRDGWGLEPLPEAGPILEAARQIGSALSQIERKASGAASEISGEIAVTTTDSIYLSAAARLLNDFQTQYPTLQLHVSVSTRPLDLNRREAEVAIRPSLAPPEHLVGRRICDLTFHPYAAPSYLDEGRIRRPADHDWLGMFETFRGAPSELWLADHVPGERIRLRADSYVALAEAARHGLGVAILPSCYGDQAEGLVRVGNLIQERIVTGLWVLTHPDIRQSPRVRAAIDFLSGALGAAGSLFDA